MSKARLQLGGVLQEVQGLLVCLIPAIVQNKQDPTVWRWLFRGLRDRDQDLQAFRKIAGCLLLKKSQWNGYQLEKDEKYKTWIIFQPSRIRLRLPP